MIRRRVTYGHLWTRAASSALARWHNGHFHRAHDLTIQLILIRWTSRPPVTVCPDRRLLQKRALLHLHKYLVLCSYTALSHIAQHPHFNPSATLPCDSDLGIVLGGVTDERLYVSLVLPSACQYV